MHRDRKDSHISHRTTSPAASFQMYPSCLRNPELNSSEDEGYLCSRACFKLMGLYSSDKGDDPKPVSQRQEASFCDWKAVAQQHMLGGGVGGSYIQSKNFLPFLSRFSCDGTVGFPAAL